MSRRSYKKRHSGILRKSILGFWTLLIFLPIVWLVYNSLKSSGEILTDPWSLPFPPVWENYVAAWNEAGIGRGFVNSLIVTFASIISIVGVSALAAYVLSRFRFKMRKFFYIYLISGLMFPTFIAMVPLFLLVNKLNLLNSLFGLILVYTAYSLPFTVFILTAFFATLPKTLEEAAIIDGCGAFRVFFSIMLPLAKPGLVSAAIFNFVGIWNEYVVALILISDSAKKTLPVTLADLMMVMQYRTDFGSMFAGLILSLVPVIVIYLIFQRQLMAGTTSGSIKG